VTAADPSGVTLGTRSAPVGILPPSFGSPSAMPPPLAVTIANSAVCRSATARIRAAACDN
jgi:hypothetical protein